MRIKILYLAILITLCFISILLSRKLRTYYTPATERKIYQTTKHHDDTLRIVFIGDSWALGHKNHNCTIAKILEDTLHHPIYFESYGIGGLTSKEIYNALFEIDGLKKLIERGCDYCIISAGINDCNKKMSKSYYSNSMDCIIRFMLTNHIHPIIIEIPDYNILDVYKNENIYNKTVRYLSMLITKTPIDCKQYFRNALDTTIIDNINLGYVSIIKYQSWNDDYVNDLINYYVADQIHLNEKGYAKLDSVIIQEIIYHYRKRLSVDKGAL